jgi:PhnB protein
MEWTMKEVNAYLLFNGNCREAITFYQKCLGGDLQITTYADMPGNIPQEAKNQIAHARIVKGGSPILMASDNMGGPPVQHSENVSVAITCESVQETDQLFNALSAKGNIKMPPQETSWAGRFAMFTDQFGINWLLNFEKPRQ